MLKHTKKILIITIVFILAGCSSVNKKNTREINKSDKINTRKNKIKKNKTIDSKNDDKENMPFSFLKVYDPLEPLNRKIYYFNYLTDRYVLIPVTNAYSFITPDPVEKGVDNFFDNLGEITNFANSILQLNLKKSTIALARFCINSTFGILGIFDVATKLELPEERENFGLTLAKYGVKQGPYLVLPILGPSNLRDAVGLGVDIAIISDIKPYDSSINFDTETVELDVLGGINSKKKYSQYKYYGTKSVFEYEYVRYIRTIIGEMKVKANNRK